jgi:hypothetical protein
VDAVLLPPVAATVIGCGEDMAAMAATVRCCGMGRKEPGRSGRRRFAALVGQLADLRLLVAAAPAEASLGRVLRHDTVAFAAGTRTGSV